jgi:Domain of unknown function (DUF4915)
MSLALTLHGEPVILVASCLGDGDTGGGLLYHDGQSWICIDDVSTTGLFVSGNELIRMLWAPSQVAGGTSILHYNTMGVLRHLTVDGLTDPHDVLWDGRHYVAVSSSQDSLVWIGVEGGIIRRFQPACGDDCWHLNSLFLHEGVLYATAFGRFEEPRGWVGHQRDGTGMIFRVDSREDVQTGLCCPHTPRFESNRWIVCNSVTSELKAFSASGELLKSAPLQDWVRGLTIADEYLLVGESVNRQLRNEVRGATVAFLDRHTWAVLQRLTLPFREIYDLVLVSPELLGGVLRSPNVRSVIPCPPRIPVTATGPPKRSHSPAQNPIQPLHKNPGILDR